MGLVSPIREKNVEEGTANDITFCKVDMQGWRSETEDRSIHEIDLGDGISIFGVLDVFAGS